MGPSQRSTASRNRRITEHLPLVEPWVRHYSRCSGEPAEDLRQVAVLGLIRAAERFNGNQQVPFAAFARPHIRGALLHYLRDQAHVIRIPRRVQEQRSAGVQPKLRRVPYTLALETSWCEPVAAERLVPSIDDLLAALTPAQRQLVVQVVLRGQSLRSVARSLGTSASTVHRRLRRALETIRRPLNPASAARGC